MTKGTGPVRFTESDAGTCIEVWTESAVTSGYIRVGSVREPIIRTTVVPRAVWELTYKDEQVEFTYTVLMPIEIDATTRAIRALAKEN